MSPPATSTVFDIAGALPGGFTVLEASAGTGKTFTIAGLAARYVAGGLPVERLLVVTFTRMATSELRERVRERLSSAEAGLGLALVGVAPDPADVVLCVLARGSPAEVEGRRRRLATALAEFDAATIATTHGLCQHILAGLGVAGDVEAEATFVEDPSDLVAEVVDDLYVRHVLGRGHPGFSRKDAGEIAARVVANPTAPLQPAAAPPGSEWARRSGLATQARRYVEQRKLRAGLLSYDDLLTRLAATLEDPERGPAACARLRQRYSVALVDEFQDTDPVQWDILRLAFGEGGTTLVLVGDPKQAIYSFRGADVWAYLEARRAAPSIATLATNWRSDQGLVDACAALFGDAHLGHPEIAFRAVQAAPAHVAAGLAGAPAGAPMRIRVVHRADGAVTLTDRGRYVAKRSGEAHVAADLAADVARLLGSGATVAGRDATGPGAARERIRPGQVAVLVRTNGQAEMVRQALEAARVPAVINGAGTVLATPVARHWLRLLEALERPASASRARAVALGPFVGWSATDLAGAGDAALESLQAELVGWAGVLDRRGVASLVELVTRTQGLPARLLAQAGGERHLTDLRHVGQLLHAEAVAANLGTSALVTWLRRRITETGNANAAEERSRRLESDAAAVQVLTIHRSKGLEFPVVYVPYLWADATFDDHLPVYHDPEGDNRRTVDVGGKGSPDHERHRRWRRQEELGEDLRLAYVALTRARHQVVLWWAASWGGRCSALGRLLFGRRAGGEVDTELKAVPDDGEAVAVLDQLAAGSGGTVVVERAGGVGSRPLAGEQAAPARLGVAPFERELDQDWQRTSYSALTERAHGGGHGAGPEEASVGSEPDRAGVADEPPVAGPGLASPAAAVDPGLERALRRVPSAWADLPGGTATGTLVHAVAEVTDFAADDLEAELAARVGEQVPRYHPGFARPAGLVTALGAALTTPLGPLLDDAPLAAVVRRDRLDELAFELPLAAPAGGSGAGGQAALDLGAVGELMAARVGPGDPLHGYAGRLGQPGLDQRLRGYLTGSIDLVVRHRGAGWAPDRFVVVDYKTNWLGAEGEPLSAWHYRPVALAAAMAHAHYPLQALFYAVALHRYLRWRLAGYDPRIHLGGVAYLFLRGMSGPATPQVDGHRCGVMSWRPPAGLVEDLSDLLDQGRTEGGPAPAGGGP